MSELARKKCVPCEGNVPPLTKEEALEMQKQVNDWSLIDEAHLLAKSFRFKDFAQTMEFVNKVAAIAEEEGHHPDLTVSYGSVTVELMTHAIGGLSENDFIVAAKIDEIKS
ncbi:MAG: 4a-hydroxytetrahydrobiopterin dehydratase [Patescibacteria group bacterium]|nr:4a-hydroxytetrahydrobiopterin dehydratase [Patescibacteria group bacterium]